MRRGDFPRAWDVSDEVLARRLRSEQPPDGPRHLQAVWDGRPLDGRRLLIRCYHGLGDTIQFARFLPTVARRSSSLTVWAQPPLIPLLETLPDIGRVVPLHDGTPEVEYEIDLEIMELGHALRVDSAALAAGVPYFCVPRGATPGSDFGVGVVAGAGSWDLRRRIPPELLEPLSRLPGVSIYSLQPGATVPGAREASAADFKTVASRVRSLDLVITVDTVMAHLAGALGVPTWTLLHTHADWRWMDGRLDSPWYPSMRLFRQRREGDWTGVIDEVLEALAQAACR